MDINRSLLNQIMKKISNTITYPFGIINADGTILAHTEIHLEGFYLKGAKELLQSEIPQLLFINEDRYYVVPAIIYNKITFGIVINAMFENAKDIIDKGKLAAEICSLMIEQFNSKAYSNYKIQKSRSFLYEWLNDYYINDRNLFNVKASELTINYFHGISVAILRIHRIFFKKDLLPQIEMIFHKFEIMYINDDLDYIIFLNSTNRSFIERTLKTLCDELKVILDNYVIAIGGMYEDPLDIKKSYNDALKLLNLYSTISQGLLFYDDFVLEAYLNDAPGKIKIEYIEKIFGKCTAEELEDLCNFILVYFDNNGSINAIADALFIHKNTVQYRINKLLSKTNYDIRKLNESFPLFVASFWYNNSQEIQYMMKNKFDN